MDHLERQIRDAFGVTTPFPRMSREELNELKWRLAALDAPSVKQWLPLVLIDEIHCPADNGDALVYLLDGNRRSEHSGRSSSVLEDFTHRQAKAVLAWLSDVAAAKYRRLCPNDLSSATEYWSARVAGS